MNVVNGRRGKLHRKKSKLSKRSSTHDSGEQRLKSDKRDDIGYLGQSLSRPLLTLKALFLVVLLLCWNSSIIIRIELIILVVVIGWIEMTFHVAEKACSDTECPRGSWENFSFSRFIRFFHSSFCLRQTKSEGSTSSEDEAPQREAMSWVTEKIYSAIDGDSDDPIFDTETQSNASSIQQITDESFDNSPLYITTLDAAETPTTESFISSPTAMTQVYSDSQDKYLPCEDKSGAPGRPLYTEIKLVGRESTVQRRTAVVQRYSNKSISLTPGEPESEEHRVLTPIIHQKELELHDPRAFSEQINSLVEVFELETQHFVQHIMNGMDKSVYFENPSYCKLWNDFMSVGVQYVHSDNQAIGDFLELTRAAYTSSVITVGASEILDECQHAPLIILIRKFFTKQHRQYLHHQLIDIVDGTETEQPTSVGCVQIALDNIFRSILRVDRATIRQKPLLQTAIKHLLRTALNYQIHMDQQTLSDLLMVISSYPKTLDESTTYFFLTHKLTSANLNFIATDARLNSALHDHLIYIIVRLFNERQQLLIQLNQLQDQIRTALLSDILLINQLASTYFHIQSKNRLIRYLESTAFICKRTYEQEHLNHLVFVFANSQLYEGLAFLFRFFTRHFNGHQQEVFDTILRAYASQKDAIAFDLALNCIINQQLLSSSINVTLYPALISQCLRWNHYVEVCQILDLMKQTKVLLEPSICASLINQLDAVRPVDENQSNPARDYLLKDIRELRDNAYILTGLLSHCIQANDYAHIRDILRIYEATWTLPNAFVCSILVKAYGEINDVSKGLTLWDRCIMDSQFKRTSHVYGCLFNMLITKGYTVHALRIFKHDFQNPDNDQSRHLNTFLYSILIKGCAKTQLSEALQLYSDMKSRRMQCNVITMNTLINGCVIENELYQASQLLQDMESNPDCQPDVVTYSILIKGYCDVGLIDDALNFFKLMETRGHIILDHIVYNTLLEGLAKHSTIQKFESFFIKMLKAGIVPSSFTLTILIKLYGKHGYLNTALDLVESLPKKYSFQSDIYVYTSIIAACLINHNIDQAIVYFEQMLTEVPSHKITGRIYGTIILGCTKHDRLIRAYQYILDAYHRNLWYHHSILNKFITAISDQKFKNDEWTLSTCQDQVNSQCQKILHIMRKKNSRSSYGAVHDH